jgi:hypothetical protein
VTTNHRNCAWPSHGLERHAHAVDVCASDVLDVSQVQHVIHVSELVGVFGPDLDTVGVAVQIFRR